MKYITITFGLFLTEYLWRFLLVLVTESIAPGSYGDSTWLFGQEVQAENIFKTAQSYPFQFITAYFLFLLPLYLAFVWLTDKSLDSIAALPQITQKRIPYVYGLAWMVVIMLVKWLYTLIDGSATLWPWQFHGPAVYFILGYTAAFLVSRDIRSEPST